MADISLTADVDTSGVASGMAAIENEVAKTANSIGTTLSGVFSPGGLISTAVTGFIAGGFKELLDKAQEIHREAERFGVDAESLQKIGNAAKEDGIGLEATARALNLLTINAQAALNPTSKQAEALRELGINAVDFAKLKPDEQFLGLADAYASSAKSGTDYANVATLIGKKNTEMIPILAKGSDAIKEQGDAMGVWNDKAVANLANVLKDFERGKAEIEAFAVNSIQWIQNLENKIEEYAQKAHNQLFNTPGAGLPVDPQTGLPAGYKVLTPGVPGGPPANKPTKEDVDLANELNAADQARWDTLQQIDQTLEAEETTRVAMLTPVQRLNELTTEHDALEQELNQEIATGGEWTDRALQLREQIANLTTEMIPLENQVADAVAREADEQARAANEAARKADEENRAAEAAQRAEQLSQQGPNPLTVNALAQDNLRLGATSDVYAQALAASRGIQPGTPEYDRLLQQITAQDELRNLQGKNLSSADQTARDKLVQWFANLQQQKTNQQADINHQQEIDFWGSIAAGRTPSGSNPYNNIFGVPNLATGQFTAPSTAPVANAQLQSQIDLLTTAVSSLQQIQKNTTLVNV